MLDDASELPQPQTRDPHVHPLPVDWIGYPAPMPTRSSRQRGVMVAISLRTVYGSSPLTPGSSLPLDPMGRREASTYITVKPKPALPAHRESGMGVVR